MDLLVVLAVVLGVYLAELLVDLDQLFLKRVDAISVLGVTGNDLILVLLILGLSLLIYSMRRQRETRRSEETYRYLFERNPNAMWTYDVKTLRFLAVNDTAIAVYGFSRDEFARMTIKDIRPVEDTPALLESTAHVQPGIEHSGNWRHRLKDGKIIDVEITSQPLAIEGQSARLVMAADVSERKRALQALEASENHFRALIENSSDGIVLLDATGTVLYRSPANARILGYRLLDAGGNVFQLVHPDDLAAFRTAFGRIRALAGESVMLEYRVRHRDGSWRWLEAVATNLLADPSVQAVVANYRDITERKLAEERIQQQVAEAEAITRISHSLRMAGTLSEMLDRVLDATLAIVHASRGSIWLHDPVLDEVRIATQRNWSIANQPPLRRGEGIPGYVLQTGEPYISADFKTDVRITEATRAIIPPGVSGACIPISSAEAPVGVMFVQVDAPRELSAAEVRLLTTVAEIAGIAIHRMRLNAQTEQRLRQLASQREIDIAILGRVDLRTTLSLLLTQIMAQLGADAADVLLLDMKSNTLEFAAAAGFRSREIEQLRVRVGEGQSGRAALELHTVIVNLREAGLPAAYGPLTTQEGFVVYVAVPLIAKGQVNGVLSIFRRSAFTPDAEWLELLETLAGQAALAIDNAQLFRGLQQAHMELTLAYDTTLEGWSRALDLRDKETEGHTQRVTDLTLELARTMGLDAADLLQVRRGALLHDIGKMGVPDRILLKPGPLTDEEWVIMRMHPVYARDLLSPIAYLQPALDIPYCHHEKWDGTGYPRGLKGEQIPLTARIFAIVDVWDALRSDRPYRPAWPAEKVREHIRSLAGTHFDNHVVEVFLNLDK
jgi:PAS domain S-box-containing protein